MSKRDSAIVKQKCPAQFLASGPTCQRDRRGFLAAPKVCVRLGITAATLQVIHWGWLTQLGCPCAGSGHSQPQPRCLPRGSAVPLGREQRQGLSWGPDSPLDSWKCYRSQKGPPAIRRMCVSINTMYCEQGTQEQSASHSRRCSSEL